MALACRKLSAVELVAKIVGLFGRNSLPGMDCKVFSPSHPSPRGESLPCTHRYLVARYSFILGQYSCCRTPCILLISWGKYYAVANGL